MSEVDLGEFLKFCKDFQIPLAKMKQQEIFKKCSNGHRPLKIEHFTNAIIRLGMEVNKLKLAEVAQKLNSLMRNGGGRSENDR